VSGHFRSSLIGRRVVVIAVGLCCLSFAASCGGPKLKPIKGQLAVVPVTGKLMMNGEPLADAQICFYTTEPLPKGTSSIRPHATTEEDGSFRVSTYGSQDGAPLGKYSVTVSWKGPAVGPAGEVGVAGDDDDRPEKVAPAFRNPRMSRIRVEVTEGENALTPWDLATYGQQQTSNTPN
jgi:hypothetical protein